MKKEEQKALREKFLIAINKVLKSTKSEMTEKSEKIINKSIKKIVKKLHKEDVAI